MRKFAAVVLAAAGALYFLMPANADIHVTLVKGKNMQLVTTALEGKQWLDDNSLTVDDLPDKFKENFADAVAVVDEVDDLGLDPANAAKIAAAQLVIDDELLGVEWTETSALTCATLTQCRNVADLVCPVLSLDSRGESVDPAVQCRVLCSDDIRIRVECL